MSSGTPLDPNRTDNHHLAWPQKAYQGETARYFRNLPCMQMFLPRPLHVWLHTYTQPPRMTPAHVMEAFIARHSNKECMCYER